MRIINTKHIMTAAKSRTSDSSVEMPLVIIDEVMEQNAATGTNLTRMEMIFTDKTFPAC